MLQLLALVLGSLQLLIELRDLAVGKVQLLLRILDVFENVVIWLV